MVRFTLAIIIVATTTTLFWVGGVLSFGAGFAILFLEDIASLPGKERAFVTGLGMFFVSTGLLLATTYWWRRTLR